MEQYYKNYGEALINNGYEILPNHKGESYCRETGWNLNVLDKNYYDEQIAKRIYNHAGIGLRCTTTPMIDIDVEDRDIADQLEEWCFENIGYTGVRTGREPKRALIYKAPQSFKSVLSNKYRDSLGLIHAIEVKSERMHMAIYNEHAKSGELYRWTEWCNPIITPRDELYEITKDQANQLIEFFEGIKPDDWVPIAKHKQYDQELLVRTDGLTADQAAMMYMTPALDISKDRIIRHLTRIKDYSYHTWFKVGCALHHQFNGSSEGFKVWDDWCSLSSEYNPYENRGVWDSLEVAPSTAHPVTAKFILSLANEAIKQAQTEEDSAVIIPKSTEYIPDTYVDDILSGVIDPSVNDPISTYVHDNDFEINNKLKLIGQKSPEEVTYSNFLSRFVYVTKGNLVADLSMPAHESVYKIEEFRNFTANITHLVPAPTEKDPDKTKRSPMYHCWQVDPDRKSARGMIYQPSNQRIISGDRGLKYMNSFYVPEHEPVSEKATSVSEGFDISKIQLFLDVLETVIPDKDERKWFTEWMAFSIQKPELRCKVTPYLITVVEGTGRGFIMEVMEKLLGQHNVKKVKAKPLMGEGSEGAYHDYLYESLITFVDEVVVSGAKKYDFMELVRDKITEGRLPLNLKYGGQLTANVYANMIFVGNEWDGIYIPANDRRVNVITCTEEIMDINRADEVYAWKDVRNNISHLHYYLSTMDIREFNWKRAMPFIGKKRVQGLTTSSTEVLVRDFIDNCTWQCAYEEQIFDEIMKGVDIFSDSDPINPTQIRKLLNMRFSKPSKQATITYKGKAIRTTKVYLLTPAARKQHANPSWVKSKVEEVETILRG